MTPRKPPRQDESEDVERVSLYPLDPLEALRAALRVDPNSEPVEEEEDG